MATRQNRRPEDEEKPKDRAIDRLARRRGRQLAADRKAKDDAAAAKKAPKPAEQAPADKDGKKNVLAQNDAGTGAKLPESPRVGAPQRVGGTRVVTQDRNEEKDERRFARDRDEWNRQKKIQRLEELDRDWRKQQSRSGFGKARFTTTFNGRRARTTGSWQSRRTSETTRSPYAAEIDRLLDGGGRGGSSTPREGRVTPDWMPQDTSKDGKQRFGAADFFGRDNRGRSSRYAGGYLSAEFRENFIGSRMEGLNPGDAGYDAARRKAEAAWGQAVRQYDRQFMQFGQEKLKEQARLDFQRRRETMLKQQAEERKKADEGRQRQLEARGVQGYDPNASPKNSVLANRELEQAAAEAVRNSAMRTGVEARIVIGSGENAIVASGGENGRSTTWVAKNDENTRQFLTSKNGRELYGNGVIVGRTGRMKQGPQVGARIGGTEMNVARREQDAGTFELVTGMKREESRKSAGGRYAGGGTIVFGDQKTFDAAVAQNQKRLRGVS